MKSLKGLFREKFIDYSAIVIALIALFISILIAWSQGNLQRELEQENKMPLLQIVFNEVDSEPINGIKLSNIGFGPARIYSFKFYKDQNAYDLKDSSSNWLETLGPYLQFYFENVNNLYDGYIIGASETYSELFLLGTTTDSVMQGAPTDEAGKFYTSNTRQVLSNLIIEIEYESLSNFDKKRYYIKYGAFLPRMVERKTVKKNDDK